MKEEIQSKPCDRAITSAEQYRSSSLVQCLYWGHGDSVAAETKTHHLKMHNRILWIISQVTNSEVERENLQIFRIPTFTILYLKNILLIEVFCIMYRVLYIH